MSFFRTNQLAEMVDGIVNSVLIPVVTGIFNRKFYGGLVLRFLDPAIRNIGKFASMSIATMEHKASNTTATPPSTSDASSKYDRKDASNMVRLKPLTSTAYNKARVSVKARAGTGRLTNLGGSLNCVLTISF